MTLTSNNGLNTNFVRALVNHLVEGNSTSFPQALKIMEHYSTPLYRDETTRSKRLQGTVHCWTRGADHRGEVRLG